MAAHLLRTITIASIFFAFTHPAKAAIEHCGKKQAANIELRCARRALWRNSHAALWVTNHRTRTLAATDGGRSRYWRNRLAFFRWRVRVDRRLIGEARSRLRARRPVLGHVALWLCIHSGEGAWNANTGNGYFGGLQMTSGWGGVARPDLLSPAAQMQLAERQYRASGFSIAWLEEQWPNTSPPCLELA